MILFHHHPSLVPFFFFVRVMVVLECGVTQVSTVTNGGVEELRPEPGVDRVLAEGFHLSNGSGMIRTYAFQRINVVMLFIAVLPPACRNDEFTSID